MRWWLGAHLGIRAHTNRGRLLVGNLHLNVTSALQSEELLALIEPFVYEFTGIHCTMLCRCHIVLTHTLRVIGLQHHTADLSVRNTALVS